MIRLLFIIVAFLMLMGALVGGLYLWGIDPLAKLGIVTGKAPVAEAPPPAPAPTYVDFGLLIVPVIQDREVKKQVEMIVRLEVPPARKELVATNLPRLQHAFLHDMMAFLSVQMREGQPLDVDAIKRRLVTVAEKVMGPELIKDVVIEGTSMN